MSLTLTDSQELLAKTARAFVEDNSPLRRVRDLRDSQDELGYSPKLWAELAELGFVGVTVPEAYGGSGLGMFDLCQILEAAGRRLMPEPFLSTVLLGAHTLTLGGSARQKERYLPRIASGDALSTLAYQEAGTRYELTSPHTRAVRSPGGYTLTGAKVQVLDAHVAELLIVSAETVSGLRLFCVDAQAPGVRIDRQIRLDGRNAAQVTLDQTPVPEDSVLGINANDTAALLRQVTDWAAVGLAAEMYGAASQVFEDTVRYLKERVQFGVAIGSFQALQHRAARLFIELSLTRSAVLGAARVMDDGPSDDAPKMASLAKARAGETFNQVTKEAVQMHGGIGVTDEHHVGFYLKRARAADATLGDSAFHRERWATLSGY